MTGSSRPRQKHRYGFKTGHNLGDFASAAVRARRFSNAAVKKRMTGTGDGSNAREPFDETRQ